VLCVEFCVLCFVSCELPSFSWTLSGPFSFGRVSARRLVWRGPHWQCLECQCDKLLAPRAVYFPGPGGNKRCDKKGEALAFPASVGGEERKDLRPFVSVLLLCRQSSSGAALHSAMDCSPQWTPLHCNALHCVLRARCTVQCAWCMSMCRPAPLLRSRLCRRPTRSMGSPSAPLERPTVRS